MAFSWFSNSSVIKYYSIFVKLQKLTYLWFLENGIIGLFGEILDQLYTTVLLTDLRKTHQKGFSSVMFILVVGIQFSYSAVPSVCIHVPVGQIHATLFLIAFGSRFAHRKISTHCSRPQGTRVVS